MGRRKKPEPNDKKQSAKFLKTAKEVQADNAKEKFESACSKVLRIGKKNS